MKFRVVCYMRVESEEEPLFDTREEAEKEAAHDRRLLPENRYEIEEVEP